jgi:hypothetical protein
MVTCSAGNNVAWLQCATAFACTGTVSAGGHYAAGIQVGSSYWGVQGWLLSAYSGGGPCFFAYPSSSSVGIHHIVFANDICNGAGQGGFESSDNGSAGVDYLAFVGNIAYNAVQGSSFCTSAFNTFAPVANDTLPGTHIYIAGNFAYDNVEPNKCDGTTPTDGQGFFFDTTNPYSQQMVIDNNIAVFNGGSGIKSYANTTGSPNARIYIRHNTTYGNETGGVNGAVCAEIALQTSYSSDVFANLSQTGASTGCSAGQALYVLGATGSLNPTGIFWGNYGYSAAAKNKSTSSATLSGNTFANPSLASPANPAAPSCGSFSTTSACMATVIANFKPSASEAQSFGYQTPSTSSIYDPLFPQWLCNVNLPPDLVTMGCLQLHLSVQVS